jgi:hypothetical protein
MDLQIEAKRVNERECMLYFESHLILCVNNLYVWVCSLQTFSYILLHMPLCYNYILIRETQLCRNMTTE